jgi:hypothetical protein
MVADSVWFFKDDFSMLKSYFQVAIRKIVKVVENIDYLHCAFKKKVSICKIIKARPRMAGKQRRSGATKIIIRHFLSNGSFIQFFRGKFKLLRMNLLNKVDYLFNLLL